MVKRERVSDSSIRNDDALKAGGMTKGKASSLPFFVCPPCRQLGQWGPVQEAA
jgi:hypothetical protein